MKPTLAHFRIGIYATINIVIFIISTPVFAADQKSSFQQELKIKNTDIAITIFSSIDTAENRSNNDLIIWLPSEHGLPDSVFTIASTLSRKYSKSEVWVVDLLGSLFLPTQASSIDKVQPEILYELIKKIQTKTNKRIFIVASGKGALLAMRASHYWMQDSLSSSQFGGLILLYPNFFIKTPEPGQSAEYYPITHGVNAPIFILQPENSPWRWQLPTLQQHLVKANARPYISILPNIRDRFFFRKDATELEELAAKNLSAIIQKSIYYLKSEKINSHSLPPKLKVNNKKKLAKQESKLREYNKISKTPTLNLKTLKSKTISLEQYRGKVVIVNFWASWCPPCVHEMPSMEKIYQHYTKSGQSNFSILAVNMAEDKNTIRDFIQNRVKISFPILLDHDGKALQDWQVFAFPSSYVIGKQGKIRYALFGSILWDTPEVTEIIDKLLLEPDTSK